jgi:hypothetical protein
MLTLHEARGLRLRLATLTGPSHVQRYDAISNAVIVKYVKKYWESF